MRHPLDGNAIAADLHYDVLDEVGTEDGETCNRVHDADEGYRPAPCKGVMQNVDEFVICRTCGEVAI